MLTRHESVSEAVVVARGEGLAIKQLVAYVVAAEGSEVSPADLRAHLATDCRST